MTQIDFNDRALSLGLARVSEAAAIACAPLIGRGDEKAADQAAVDSMRMGSEGESSSYTIALPCIRTRR